MTTGLSPVVEENVRLDAGENSNVARAENKYVSFSHE